jgi:hypothetical protein
LLSPDGALRCDCGYDFGTGTVQGSFLVAHVLEKHGGAAQIVEKSAREKIRSGLVLLGLGVILTVVGYLTTGQVVFLGGALTLGAAMLHAGIRQRRQRLLDDATLKDLLRRS